MKAVLILLLAFPFSSDAQRSIASQEKNDNRNLVHVVGYVTDIKRIHNTKIRGVFVQLSSVNLSNPLMIVILNHDLKKFGNLSERYLNRYVHVTGSVSKRDGNSYIFISSQKQMTELFEAPEINSFEPL